MMTATGTPSNPTSGSRQAAIQEIAPDPAQALEAGIGLARKIAACGPLGITTTLESAHLSIDESEAAAFAKLNGQFGGLFRTGDFIEGRKAEAEGRPPVYQGK
jgi:enoyl-CoA hydratase/carnithine racemase